MAQRVVTGVKKNLNDDLLALLGEELKNPLVAIAQLTELGSKDPRIMAHTKKALNTIDNVLLYKRFAAGQLAMNLEPVHVGSAINDVLRTVAPQMEMSGCHSEVIIQHSLQPVDVDRRLLQSALLSLWQAFASTIRNSSDIVCTAHNAHDGVRLSVLSASASIDELTLAQTNDASTQPVTGVAGPATDLMTANGMFRLAGTKITKSRRKNMTGLGVTLQVSRQLHLV